MIAKVRIAPIERWCKWALSNNRIENRKRAVGMQMKIITETCRQSPWCDGKYWQQEDSNIDEIRIATGLHPRIASYPCFACEHMLEMD